MQTPTSPVKKETEKMNVPPKPHRPRRAGLVASLATAVALLASAMVAPPAMAEFGFEKLDLAFTNQDPSFSGPISSATQAGSHPFAITVTTNLNTKIDSEGAEVPDEELRSLIAEQPRGFIGDATAGPDCSTAAFLEIRNLRNACPDRTAVGFVAFRLSIGGKSTGGYFTEPVYSLPPTPGVPVTLGFTGIYVPVVIQVGVSQKAPYNVVATVPAAPQAVLFFGSQLTLWGNPSDPAHDPYRGSCLKTSSGATPIFESTGGSCSVELPEKPFLTLPGTCEKPLGSTFEGDSWQNPARWVTGSVLTHDSSVPPNPQGLTGCGKLGFSPSIESEATTDQAETGTGFDFNVNFNDQGLTSTTGLAESTIKKAEVTLPDGVTINPSVGEGLGVCTPADLKRENIDTPPGEGCPGPSKLGTLHVDSPLVEEPIDGSVYLAQEDDPTTTEPGAENPFDSLIAVYLVLRNPSLGVLIKLPVKVEPDPKTGRLVATLEDNPQVPFSRFNFHFREGARAPLITPSACGTYTTKAVFTPWANPDKPRTVFSSFEITKGIGGGPCPPGGIPPFHPDFQAGSINNNAASFSPFNMRLIREDGEQDMTKFSAILPPGEVGSLVGVDKCPDAAIAAAKAKTGRQELASPSCPANSLIGHTLAGAGVGSALTYVGGQLYLGGAFHGDPLSVIAVTPAVAGPFDAGTVVVHLALTLNPKTAEVEVDGANSDPIPHILKGIVLKVRDLRVYVDRPNFLLNPTSCDESKARATLFGSYLNVFDPTDDVPVDLSSRFQAANCLNLGFKPSLALNLKGGTKRGGHPGLTATYKPRPGDANVKGLVVRLPRSAFLDQAHIRTICTRVQFAAKACPPAAQYGFIKAWTPLLEEPLEGPVWLRSSSHKLPDLVFDLHGLVDVEVATRIDSSHGGIRASIESAPDAALSKVVLKMQGGKKGLIINSRNLCGGTNKANVQLTGHNGKEATSNPVMKPDCGGKRKHKRHHG